ncbi:uncharacterized protein PG998_006434 [Apiospora kogelbergensis]|uniref:uncharacterized protein n=1 Tax=Apiospora kogelbergensis TaxID=1337665 RepID=UPI003131DA07
MVDGRDKPDGMGAITPSGGSGSADRFFFLGFATGASAWADVTVGTTEVEVEGLRGGRGDDGGASGDFGGGGGRGAGVALAADSGALAFLEGRRWFGLFG